ncbi:hypothetical protein [Candidatus Uabimicrobium amorphum]|uniref:Uncharacterized protein n=1 Tax=Uabimicrobium amorphum TaxID=2596890 RepID=A0A5S9IPR5_UABAM|nr:hypothetical protein [Candidatus Uabimicrobium amorphum]BBM84435.1 hypothetical protein UABAM_02795 [Candidatus Uabimicrobium amorphum]
MSEHGQYLAKYRFLSGIAETYESRSLARSPQQVLIPAGEVLWIPVTKAEVGHTVVTKKITFRAFSAQAEQDCNIVLDVGDHYLFKSGKFADPNKSRGTFNSRFVKEDRTPGSSAVYSGGLLTQSSAASGVATFPDNFITSERYHAICKENQDIYWKVLNQSAVYDHVLLLNVYAWFYPNKEV